MVVFVGRYSSKTQVRDNQCHRLRQAAGMWSTTGRSEGASLTLEQATIASLVLGDFRALQNQIAA